MGPEAFAALNLPAEVREQATKMANAGLSESTKSQYRSAWKLAKEAEEALEETFEMPWSTKNTVMFVVYARNRHIPN